MENQLRAVYQIDASILAHWCAATNDADECIFSLYFEDEKLIWG